MKKSIAKIAAIITGWWYYFCGVPYPLSLLADDRLTICKSNVCGKLKWGICTACGCPVNAKTKVKAEECPENMWKPIIYEEDGIEYIDTVELPVQIAAQFKHWAEQTHPRHGRYPNKSLWEKFIEEVL